MVTGFGPFQDAPENPTTILAGQLEDYLKQHETLTNPETTTLSTMVLEVSVEAVKEALNELWEKQPSWPNNHNKDTHNIVILLHLGVNYKGVGFQLEQCAYNDATFRIPDQRGYQPQQEIILPNVQWGKALNTNLNLESIGEHLKQIYQCEILTKQQAEETTSVANNPNNNNKEIKIIHSTDPGRYVCNYTYCYSLDKFGSSTTGTAANIEEEDNTNHQETKCYSLFLHVPPFEVTPEAQQMKFLAELIRLIELEMVSDNGNPE